MKKYLKFLVPGLALCPLLFMSCTQNYYPSRRLTRESRNVPVEPGIEEKIETPRGGDPNINYYRLAESWDQQGKPTAQAAELLFVFDTSGSMGNNIKAVNASIKEWVGLLSNHFEGFCLSAMPAGTSPERTGRLIKNGKGQACVCTFGENAVSNASAVEGFGAILDVF